MNPFTIINVITNCTTAISCIALLVHIFGDPNNPIWDNKIKAWLAKVGLTITICGAISNAITLTTPPPTQVLLDCGISLTLCWLSWWQWELFKSKLLSIPTVSVEKKGKVVAKKTKKAVKR